MVSRKTALAALKYPLRTPTLWHRKTLRDSQSPHGTTGSQKTLLAKGAESPRLEAHMYTDRGSGAQPRAIGRDSPLTTPNLNGPSVTDERPRNTVNVLPTRALCRRTQGGLGRSADGASSKPLMPVDRHGPRGGLDGPQSVPKFATRRVP